MAGFGVRGAGASKGGNGGSKIDWSKVNEGIAEGLNPARIVQIIDLGTHKEEVRLGGGDKSFTFFDTEEEVDAFYEEIVAKYGAKNAALNTSRLVIEYNEEKGKWSINVNEFGGDRAYQEVAIMIDFPDMEVDYGELGVKPYRSMVNTVYEKDLKGFQMKKQAPKTEGGIWTFAPNSMMAGLAKATGCKQILEDKDYGIDRIDLLLGKAFNIPVELTEKGFVKLGKPVALMAKQQVSELQDEAIIIDFTTLTVEILEKANLRKAVFDKWKKAEDYNLIKDVVEAYEAKRTSSSKKDKEEVVDDDPAQNPVKRNKVQKVTKSPEQQAQEDAEDEEHIANW